MIIDSHCHLNYEPMTNSISDVVKRANENGVKYMLTISVDDKNYKNILDIVKKNKCVYGTYGLHPHEAKNYSNIKSNDIVSKIKMNKKIIGIGETGLDFYYNYSEKKDQISLFIEHIKAAIETKLPLIVHTRSAEDETYEILKKFSDNKNLKILIHCFTGSKKFADKLINIGSYISASGVVTFKKSNDLVATFKDIPIDKMLVETDSPYLSPEPLRGKSNEPSHIIHTVKFLSTLRNITYENFSKITSNNFFRLFGNLNAK
jgi:TatD DNase family protein